MGAEARELAQQLDTENIRRQQEEADIVAAARKAVETDLDVGSRTVIVVAGEGWHRGVIGIVASKLVDAFHRPAIVISTDGDVAHGSCRSIPSFNMLGALESCGEVMSKFGGHKQAAGLTMASDRVRELRARVNDYADGCLHPDDLRPRIWIDGALGFKSIDEQVATELAALAPFGAGNPRPIFRASGVEIVDGPRRIKERHLKMAFRRTAASCAASPGEPRSERSSWPSIAPPSTWRSHSSRTPGTGSGTSSSRLPISRLPKTDYPEA